MATVESTVTIARPVEEVFGFFIDFDKNARQMDPTIESVMRTPMGPTRPGTAFRFSQQILGRMRDTTTTFTSIEPNRKIEIAASFGPLRPKGAFTFNEGNRSTTVTVRVNPDPVGPFKLLAPFFARVAQKIWAQRFARIKAALESSPRSGDFQRPPHEPTP
jgi:uncharacterized protein YndB with AHSA1/START domain